MPPFFLPSRQHSVRYHHSRPPPLIFPVGMSGAPFSKRLARLRGRRLTAALSLSLSLSRSPSLAASSFLVLLTAREEQAGGPAEQQQQQQPHNNPEEGVRRCWQEAGLGRGAGATQAGLLLRRGALFHEGR